jgi:hypothetical protein
VVVGEAPPDGGGGDGGVCVDHRVDVGVQALLRLVPSDNGRPPWKNRE